jgi:hypothetical protein
MLDRRVSNVDSRVTNPAVLKVTHVAPTTAKKVKYGGRVSLYYFQFLRMFEASINVRGLIEERRNFLVTAHKILKTNFTASTVRGLYKRGVNTHHGSVYRICWKGKCIASLSSFCKLATTLITKGGRGSYVIRVSLNTTLSGTTLILVPYIFIFD